MAEIDYEKEKCWQIKEQRPIKVFKSKRDVDRWVIDVKPMVMEYETFNYLTMNINHWRYCDYDYENGEARIVVTDEGLKELEKMNDIITIK